MVDSAFQLLKRFCGLVYFCFVVHFVCNLHDGCYFKHVIKYEFNFGSKKKIK